MSSRGDVVGVADPPLSRTGRTSGRGPGRIASIISEDLIVDGSLYSDGDVQVEGQVNGDVRGLGVTVGDRAVVHGDVEADSVRVSGIVKGQVTANSVFLAKSAKVIGDIVHQTLCIEAGAYLEGNCRRTVDQPARSPGSPDTLPKQVASARKSSPG
jgi:cytoskeletal protein CcmA (bactofilin family)